MIKCAMMRSFAETSTLANILPAQSLVGSLDAAEAAFVWRGQLPSSPRTPLLCTSPSCPCWTLQRRLLCHSQSPSPCLSMYSTPRLPARTHPQALIGLLDAAEAACGRRDQLPELLDGCIAASVEAAFDASLEQLSTNVTAGGPACLLRSMRRDRRGMLACPCLPGAVVSQRYCM